MGSKTKLRKVPKIDKGDWEREFRTRVLNNQTAKAAFRRLMSAGCMWGNVMNFLLAYTFGETMVFRDHARMRNTAIAGLRSMEGRLDRATGAMREILSLEWRGKATFGSFLQECRLDFQGVSDIGRVIRGKCAPDFVVHLPAVLESYSLNLKHLRKQLQRELSVRKVGISIYLAEFAIYIEAITHHEVPWTDIAELVNAARPISYAEKYVSPSLLQKNFNSFRLRNPQFYEQIRREVSEYLAFCDKLPLKERPTFVRWSLDHGNSTNRPS